MTGKKVLHIFRNGTAALSIVCMVTAVFLLLHMVWHEEEREIRAQTPVEVAHRVLFICSYNPLYFTYEAQARGLEKALYPNGIEYDVVFMDAKTYNSEHDILVFHDFLSERLKNRTDYEAVLLGDDDALLFALRYQDELFAGLPMVFFGVNDISLARKAAQNPYVTGFYENTYLLQAVGLATRLFPESKKLAALHDRSAAGIADAEILTSYAQSYPEYTFIDIDTATMTQEELARVLEKLPQDTLLFYMTCYSDKNGTAYSMLSYTNTVAKHTHVPIFRNYVGGEGQGVLGSMYMDFEDQCSMAGQTLVQVLSGSDIAQIPLSTQSPSRCTFDYSLMRKYNLNSAMLPADTVFYNRRITLFEQYGRILPVACSIAAALLLFALSANFASAEARITNKDLLASRNKLAESQEQLRYQAEYDEVLDILNRRTITEQMRRNLTQNMTYSVLIVDIDGFKALNENYGHQVSDSILQYMVALFKGMAKEGDWQIARYGGDEFLLLIHNEQLTREHRIVKKIMDGIHTPIPLGTETLAITASMGISVSDGITMPEQHIINAEIAMNEAKDHGRNGVSVYGDEMKEKVREENRIKIKLTEAFDNDGFFMLYQPQINSQTKEVSGYEALVRMKEPGIFPSQFIPIAERSGWIWRIGRITTELVIRQLSQWRKAGHTLHPVSVNFSSKQLNDHGYIDFIQELLERYDVPAHYLEIEITEGLFLEKSVLADKIFKRFKDLGIRLLMDDFGTGYSSLGYLTYLPVDVIKLDKSLVDTYLVDGKDSFIRNIIHLMHGIDKEMIIEGVEEEWQFERLREFGADAIQGYYFSKPIPAEQAIVFKAK